MKNLLAFFFALLLTGCATASPFRFDDKNLSTKLRQGMTTQEVVGVLGPPKNVSRFNTQASGAWEVWTFAGDWCNHDPMINFRDGRLVDVSITRDTQGIGCS